MLDRRGLIVNMLLGCNYSSQLIELMQEEKVNVDYIKLGLYEMYEEAFDISCSISPVLIHGVGLDERTSMKSLNKIDWDSINNSIRKFRSPHLGIHLIAHSDDWEELVEYDVIVERMIKVAKTWSKNIQVPFLLENTPWSPYYQQKGILPCSADADLIRKICEEADVGLLLDTSHAKISASHRNEDIFSYLEKFPLEKVKEIHTVGSMMTEEHGLKDKHQEMQEEDYEILNWILQKTNPNVVTLEYGGPGELFSWRSDKEALERQLVRLMEICKRY